MIDKLETKHQMESYDYVREVSTAELVAKINEIIERLNNLEGGEVSQAKFNEEKRK